MNGRGGRPDQTTVAESVEPVQEKKKPVRNIRVHADKEVRRAFPEICQGLIEKAKEGSMGQTKLLMKISGLDAEPAGGVRRRRGKTLSALLMAELKKGSEPASNAGPGAGCGSEQG